MNLSLNKFKHYHLIGIAGNGMSAIARCLLKSGYIVSGSDLIENDLTRQLEALGAIICRGHDAKKLTGVEAIVISTAIDERNPELQRAKEEGIPIFHRSDVLAAYLSACFGVGISGSHGKTTTCAMLVDILNQAGLNPSYALGAPLCSTGLNADVQDSKYFVAELDESDASFLNANPKFSVITNVDEDHMETYDFSTDRLRESFIQFANQSEVAFLGIDDQSVDDLKEGVLSKIITFGFKEGVEVRATQLQAVGLQSSFNCLGESFILNLPGSHNVLNALAAIAVARELNVSLGDMKIALEQFQGVSRRAEIIEDFQFQNKTITFVHDYGHHPVEIDSMIKTLKEIYPNKRLLMVFQPHRYTRTRDLMNEFSNVLSNVNELVLLDVYAASEEPIQGATSSDLLAKIDMDNKFYLTPDDLQSHLQSTISEGDILVFQGAGDFFGHLSYFL